MANKMKSKSSLLARAMMGSSQMPTPRAPTPEELASEKVWEPELSPCQLRAYRDRRRVVELDGERGSGKTVTADDIVARHCYDTRNALVQIYVVVKSAGKSGGIWEKLVTRDRKGDGTPLGILQAWEDKIGLEFDGPRSDDAKQIYCMVKNRYGLWVRINYKPIPPGDSISGSVKGSEPSLVVIDEYNCTNDPAHAPRMISKVLQQLGRRQAERQNLKGEWEPAPQQLILCGNPPDLGPDDPSFKLLFIDYPTAQGRKPLAEVDGDTAIFVHNDDPFIGRWHITASENRWLDIETYHQSIRMEIAGDPTAEDRNIRGIWRKKTTGSGIFFGYWNPDVHVRPAITERGGAAGRLFPLIPERIVVGYDPGDVNNARVFMQPVMVGNGDDAVLKWRIFDEMVSTDSFIGIDAKVRFCMERRLMWCRMMEYDFNFVDIADMQSISGFNRFSDAGYEAQQHESISARMIATDKRFSKMTPIRIMCPRKDPGSVAERVKILRDLLLSERIIVSRSCPKVIEMFAFLKKEANRSGGGEQDMKPRRSRHIHVFDAVTYPMLFWSQNNLTGTGKEVELRTMSVNL